MLANNITLGWGGGFRVVPAVEARLGLPLDVCRLHRLCFALEEGLGSDRRLR